MMRKKPESLRPRPAEGRRSERASDDALLDPTGSLGYQIRYLYRSFVKALAIELSPHGITTSQWSALRILWQEEGLSQVELAQRMLVEKASLTSVLESMTTRGLIVRTRNADDRRKVNIFLTPAGRRLKAELLPFGDRINRRAVRGMPAAEVAQLQRLLSRLRTNLDS